MSSGLVDSFGDDDSIDIDLRPVDDVVRRAVLLATLLRRAGMEESEPASDESAAFERETDRFELYSWAKAELGSVWNEEEQALLRTPAGGLSEAQLDDCLDAARPATALGWALGAIHALDLEGDQNPDVQSLLAWAPEPWSELAKLARKSSLRPEGVIASERERWELWYWRATVDESDMEPDEYLDELVADVAHVVADTGMIGIAKDDFDVDGAPFRTLQSDEQSRIAELSEAWLLALNWVCGFGESWDDVPFYPD